MKHDRITSRTAEIQTMSVLALFFLALHLAWGKQWFLHVAVVFLLIGLFIPPVAAVLTKYWLLFSKKVGAVNSRVILSLVYYLLLTPLAVAYRVFNRDPLSLRAKGNNVSSYVDRNHTYVADDLEKMW